MSHSLPRPLIGIVVPTVDNAFFSSLAEHAGRCLFEKGFTPLMLSSGNHAETEKEHLRSLAALNAGLKAIICVGETLEQREPPHSAAAGLSGRNAPEPPGAGL